MEQISSIAIKWLVSKCNPQSITLGKCMFSCVINTYFFLLRPNLTFAVEFILRCSQNIFTTLFTILETLGIL